MVRTAGHNSATTTVTSRLVHMCLCLSGRGNTAPSSTVLSSFALAVSLLLSGVPGVASSLIHEVREVPAPFGAEGLCDKYQWFCDRSSSARVRGSEEELRLAEKVNLSVNKAVREITDATQYGENETWALPTMRGGDCEDFALLKKRELIRLGVAPSRLLLATALDRRRNAHAVLILQTESGYYVLDNLTNRITTWKATGYSFLRMQNPTTDSGWTLVMRGGIFPS